MTTMRLLFIPVIILLASCAGPAYNGLEVDEFEAKVASGDYFLIDMYTPGDERKDMIEGAYLLNTDSKEERVALKDMSKDKEVLLYCSHGKGADRFMQHLESIGYPKVSQLEGGLGEWKKEGKPVVPFTK